MKYTISLLCLYAILADFSYAVRTNGVNDDKEYVVLAQKPQFSAVGCIYNITPSAGGCFTGTIIDDKGTGITCAHAFDKVILKYLDENPHCLDFISDGYPPDEEQLKALSIPLNNYYMDFASELVSNPRHKIVSVLVNPYYMRSLQLNERHSKRVRYDTAAIQLESPPIHITPIPVIKKTHGTPKPAVFLGYGDGDTHHNQKRAAYVPNLKANKSKSSGEFFSSLFFDPEGLTTDAMNWDKQGQPIYGHGELGDSGGPLLARAKNGRYFVVGVVSCYTVRSNYDGTPIDIDFDFKDEVYAEVRSDFAPLVSTHIPGSRLELIDKMINAISSTPARSRRARSSNITASISSSDLNGLVSTASPQPTGSIPSEN
jgi:hypothetical protein